MDPTMNHSSLHPRPGGESNIYVTGTTASISISARKVICSACPVPNCFRFGLFDGNGNEVATTVNDKNGLVLFPPISCREPGVYTYTVRELNDSDDDWQMDRHVYPVTATVSRREDGSLRAHVQYPEGPLVFINRCCAQSRRRPRL